MNEPQSITAMDLARREDFTFGGVTIRPSIRMLEGEAGCVTLEPRVLQVFLTLHEANPGVVTREELLQLCWGGVIVGDDAINRTIAEIRRAIREIGADFVVETVPRVGYRLLLTGAAQAEIDPDGRAAPLRLGRRPLLAGGLAGAGLLLAGFSGFRQYSRNSEFERAMALGIKAERLGNPAALKQAEQHFRSAIAIDGRNAEAWGWLARVLGKSEASREAARRALVLDPANANARMSLVAQEWGLTSWKRWEGQVAAILEDFPEHDLALDTMVLFHQGVGRCGSSWNLNERAAQAQPFDPVPLNRRAIKHWIFGRTEAADKVADRCVEMWPKNPFVWNARMIIYAFTDRADAGLAFLEDEEVRPADLKRASVETWRAILVAVGSRTTRDIAAAVAACTAAARLAPGLAANAIMALSWLGEIDQAYRVADGLFAARGKVVQRWRGRGLRDVYSDTAWARSQFLFIPATAALRADPRFEDLCQIAGLMTYWRERGIGPDPFVQGSLRIV
jgi:DNA-binding winged helix-turn-helix (wHTH) protein